MDRTRFSHIAHREMEFCSPIGGARVARAIELLELTPQSRVVDFGAGKFGWLARVSTEMQRLGRQQRACIGVEPAKLFADEARERHAALFRSASLELVESSAAEFVAARGGERFDVALCIGSTHAFGDYVKTLEALKSCLVGGGVMVVAEGYWKRAPGAEYLKVLGGDESEFTTHAGNIQRAMERGLTPRWCCTVSDDEWDEYEWGYSRGIESWIREHPDDPDREAMLARSRAWREAYVKWGRETLGIGVYVLGV